MRAHIEKLAGEIGVRHGGSRQERAASEYVRQQLLSYGYTVTKVPVELPDKKTSINILTELPGDTPRVLLVGAHIDSYGAAPGANDNASGIAVMLEVARLLRDIKPNYTLIFAGFCAEEHLRRGDAYHHFGSRAMAKDTALLQRLAGMVSLDMVGYGTVLRIDNQGWASDRRRDEIGGIARAMGLPARVGRSKPQSDHEAFERRHISAAYLHWERYPAYHTRADVPARIQSERLRRTAELMIRFLRNARDDEPERRRSAHP